MELLENNVHYVFGLAIAVLVIAMFAYLQGANVKVLVKGFFGVFVCSLIVMATLLVNQI
ncbi:hypothetical protein VII00023_20692 [Vibrio ichthyoenteri ATCC 700023]|uniref:Uncharacterized protein n=1 Tax=Vibrio ichthyoenteri ATCC 700023 TaxID=870968 RepID=F9S7V1_9VIBR|nr:hypothetical protein [Vibrio ichthyoenteri]EGU31001.1 hypothetical protein VII00023_20692 [Vibrio ichthyoenteri ATCC 700023]